MTSDILINIKHLDWLAEEAAKGRMHRKKRRYFIPKVSIDIIRKCKAIKVEKCWSNIKDMKRVINTITSIKDIWRVINANIKKSVCNNRPNIDFKKVKIIVDLMKAMLPMNLSYFSCKVGKFII